MSKENGNVVSGFVLLILGTSFFSQTILYDSSVTHAFENFCWQEVKEESNTCFSE